MRVEFLSYILEVAKLGSISAAGKKLWIGTTSLSAMIKSVEDELNTELFIRTPKGVVLTDEGRDLLPQIEKTVESYHIMCEMASRPSSHRSVCALACYPALSPLLGPYVAEKLSHEPDYIINVKNTLSYRVAHAVSDGVADVGVATIPADHYSDFLEYADKATLHMQKLSDDYFTLCVRGGSPLSREKSPNVEAIARFHHCSASFFPQFTGSYPVINYDDYAQRSVFDDMESIKRMVAISDSVALLPSIVLKDDIYVCQGLIDVIPLTDEKYHLVNVMVYPSKPHLPPAVRCTVAAVEEFFSLYRE